jgi:hypothetical protein
VLEAEAQLLQKYALQGVFVGEKQDRFEQIQKDLNDKKFLEVLNHLQELKISKQSLSFLETQLKNHLKELDVSWDDILEDMAITESLESASFSHTLKRITVFSDGRTENQPVPRTFLLKDYKMYENFLGMVVTSKPRGLFESEVRKTDPVSPPGYRYVGDSRYGKWEKNSSGQPFWVFYGQYALLRDLLWRNQYQPIHISQHKSFVTHQQSGQAFFGAQNEYGSKGSWTQNQYKSSSYLRTQGYKDTGWKSSGGAFAGKKYSPSYREQESARTSSSRRSFFGSSSSTSSSRSSGFGSGSRSFGK